MNFPRRSLLLGALPAGLGLLSAGCQTRPSSLSVEGPLPRKKSAPGRPPELANDSTPTTQNPEPETAASPSAEPTEEIALDDASMTEEHDPLECETVVSVVARNHGHILTVSAAEVLSAESRVYQLRGTASHGHTLSITPEDFTLLASGGSLRKRTDFGADHRHRVLVRCQPAVLPPELVTSCEVIVAGKDGHDCVIPESHVKEATPRKYDIQGVSGHTHQLSLSSDDFRRLRTGEKLDLTTSQELGHFHHVYIRYLGEGRSPEVPHRRGAHRG